LGNIGFRYFNTDYDLIMMDDYGHMGRETYLRLYYKFGRKNSHMALMFGEKKYKFRISYDYYYADNGLRIGHKFYNYYKDLYVFFADVRIINSRIYYRERYSWPGYKYFKEKYLSEVPGIIKENLGYYPLQEGWEGLKKFIDKIEEIKPKIKKKNTIEQLNSLLKKAKIFYTFQ